MVNDKIVNKKRAVIETALSFGDPANFNLWGEEDARQLHELRSNEVIDRRVRRVTLLGLKPRTFRTGI